MCNAILIGYVLNNESTRKVLISSCNNIITNNYLFQIIKIKNQNS